MRDALPTTATPLLPPLASSAMSAASASAARTKASSSSNPSGPSPPQTSSPSFKMPTAPCPHHSVTRHVVVDNCRCNRHCQITRRWQRGISCCHHSRRGLCRRRSHLSSCRLVVVSTTPPLIPWPPSHTALDFICLPAVSLDCQRPPPSNFYARAPPPYSSKPCRARREDPGACPNCCFWC